MTIVESKKITTNKPINKVETDKYKKSNKNEIIATTYLRSCVAIIFVLDGEAYLLHYYSTFSSGTFFLEKMFKNKDFVSKIKRTVLVPGVNCSNQKLDRLVNLLGDCEIVFPFVVFDGIIPGTNQTVDFPIGSIAYDIEKDEFFGYNNLGEKEELFEYQENMINTNNIVKCRDFKMNCNIEGSDNYGKSL